MTIALYRYKCLLRENGIIYCKYRLNSNLYDEILDALGNEPAEFPVKFTVLDTFHVDDTLLQLRILRSIRRFKVIKTKNFILLVKRKSNKNKRIDDEFIFSSSFYLYFKEIWI